MRASGWNSILFPIIIFLYEKRIFEFLGYIISILLIADGMKVNKEWGFFISFTGAGFIIALLQVIYSATTKKAREEFKEGLNKFKS